jgi:hypothetical protein
MTAGGFEWAHVSNFRFPAIFENFYFFVHFPSVLMSAGISRAVTRIV